MRRFQPGSYPQSKPENVNIPQIYENIEAYVSSPPPPQNYVASSASAQTYVSSPPPPPYTGYHHIVTTDSLSR